MKLKKVITSALAVTTLLSVMTVSAFASTPQEKTAEANCYITGSLGSAESSGICGGVYDSWFVDTGSPIEGKDGYNKNTWEDANDAITWTLSDGILTFSGTGGTALCMNLLFENNPHIEHIVIEEGITYFDGKMFSNLPNLSTIVVMDASTDYGYLNPDVKETVDTIIIGANLKNTRTPMLSKNYANSKTIVLTNNVTWGNITSSNDRTDADKPILRDDLTAYNRNKGFVMQNGKVVNDSLIGKNISGNATMLPVNTVIAKAREALADVPASIIAKLPSELTGVESTQNNAQTNVPTDNQNNPTQFGDVKPGAYYADAVKWAVKQGITSGTTNSTFSPDNTCTKAQILTFLWRANGSPDMTSFGNPFSDIKTTDYYYHAALWAYTKGIIHGMTFEPNTPCSRMDTVFYMWVAAGRPEIKTGNSFNDLNNGNYGTMHFNAVNWAVANSVTSGTSATTFSPENTCTRGQIATFLYRAFAD